MMPNEMTADMVLSSKIGTHPLQTVPPTAYPFIKAAENAARKNRA